MHSRIQPLFCRLRIRANTQRILKKHNKYYWQYRAYSDYSICNIHQSKNQSNWMAKVRDCCLYRESHLLSLYSLHFLVRVFYQRIFCLFFSPVLTSVWYFLFYIEFGFDQQLPCDGSLWHVYHHDGKLLEFRTVKIAQFGLNWSLGMENL